MTPRLAVTGGVALLSAAIVCVPTVAATGAVPQPPQYATPAVSVALADARKLIEAGHARAAIEKLQAIDPGLKDSSVEELLGVAYYHANDIARAIEHLGPIVHGLPMDSFARTEALQVLGLSHYLAGHLAESIPYLEEVVVMADDSKLSYALGMAYAQTRRPEKAREAFARTFHLPTGSAAAHVMAGVMMNRLELEDLAEAELKAALEQDPKVPEAHYLLGQIAIFRSRLDEGLALMREELAINPAHAMALYRVGDIYSRQLKWERAIEALQQSLWINPYFSGPLILLGKAYSKTNQLEAAEDMLRRAIQVDPNNKSAHYLLAQLLQQTGRDEEAKREFGIAERLQGDVVK